MYPTAIEVTNLGPYRGTHRLELTDEVYAVVAQHESDKERSNWQGKSTFLWLIPYALFGLHPNVNDNAWINDHAGYGMVQLWLSDGTHIARGKKTDKPTQLEVTLPERQPLKQKPAQAALDAHLGMTKDDFLATCFYEQKQLARMVTAKSAERIEIVEAWLAEDLAPIQAMHARAVDDMAKTAKKRNSLKIDEERILRDAHELMLEYGYDDGTDIPASMEMEVERAERDLADAEAMFKHAQKARVDAEQWVVQRKLDEEIDRINVQGGQLKEELDGLDEPSDVEAARKAEAEARAAEAEARQTLDGSRVSAIFDGICPVNCESCPSADWVRSQGVAPSVMAKREKAANRASSELVRLSVARKKAEAEVASRQKKMARLATMREQAEALIAKCEELHGDEPDILSLDTAVTNAELAVRQASEKLTSVKSDRDWVVQSTKELVDCREQLRELKQLETVQREAVQLLGKTGAQRELAQRALSVVETEANALLNSAGISLSVSVTWESKAHGLAKHCDQCGAAFPASAKVKKCTHCDADRGPNMVAKLNIQLSNRSGAAEDLVGIAVGLAASTWLRAKRASAWSCVCIDEPFGALDGYNKRALSVHVATLLKRTFASAYIVAHDKSILDSLPGRVTVVGSPNGSRLEN